MMESAVSSSPGVSEQESATERSAGAQYEPFADAVARELRARILDGLLRPGEPLRQVALAREFGVSRVPVREALRRLEAEGLILSRPHSGARVALLDFSDCLEIYKIRERLEPLALSESVGRLSSDQLSRVALLANELEDLTQDPAAWLEGDRRLHLACYAGVPPGRLLGMIVGYWNTTQHYRRVLLSTFTAEDYSVAHAQHQLIEHALRTENARAGEEVIRQAMESSRLRLERSRHLFDR